MTRATRPATRLPSAAVPSSSSLNWESALTVHVAMPPRHISGTRSAFRLLLR